jgi:uroporphyrinogen decarboxylase
MALWMGDDMGFKTGTMISPRHLRKYVFPIQKQIAAIAHQKGLPFLLHSCGNLEAVMEDLINEVGIDAKHSFEDVIEPVEQFSARYGNRIAVIGGVDLDLLARGTEEQIRTRTRQILTACAPSGGYVLGSGNSIANYIPPRNFLAMLDEGWRFNSGM